MGHPPPPARLRLGGTTRFAAQGLRSALFSFWGPGAERRISAELLRICLTSPLPLAGHSVPSSLPTSHHGPAPRACAEGYILN